METHIVPSTNFVELADAEGRLVLLPATTIEALRKRGITQITITVQIPPETPVDAWLTVTQAAGMHLEDVSGMDLPSAKSIISRECKDGKIVATGNGRERRIEPNSFAAWRLSRRERSLDASDSADIS